MARHPARSPGYHPSHVGASRVIYVDEIDRHQRDAQILVRRGIRFRPSKWRGISEFDRYRSKTKSRPRRRCRSSLSTNSASARPLRRAALTRNAGSGQGLRSCRSTGHSRRTCRGGKMTPTLIPPLDADTIAYGGSYPGVQTKRHPLSHNHRRCGSAPGFAPSTAVRFQNSPATSRSTPISAPHYEKLAMTPQPRTEAADKFDVDPVLKRILRENHYAL